MMYKLFGKWYVNCGANCQISSLWTSLPSAVAPNSVPTGLRKSYTDLLCSIVHPLVNKQYFLWVRAPNISDLTRRGYCCLRTIRYNEKQLTGSKEPVIYYVASLPCSLPITTVIILYQIIRLLTYSWWHIRRWHIRNREQGWNGSTSYRSSFIIAIFGPVASRCTVSLVHKFAVASYKCRTRERALICNSSVTARSCQFRFVQKG